MKLAFVSPFVDRSHGTERAAAELLQRLAEDHECEITLYSQRVEDLRLSKRKPDAPGTSGAIYWRKVPAVPGPHVVKFICWMILNTLLRKWDVLLKRANFDYVISPGINCLDADVVIVHVLFRRLQELSKNQPAPSDQQDGFLRILHRRIYYRLLNRLEQRVYTNRAIALAAVSQRISILLKEYFDREDVPVAPNGVDTKLFAPAARLERREPSRQRRGIREEEFVLLLIGNDWRVKGLPVVIEALSLMADLPIRLLVVGSDTAAPFQSKARKLGIESRCLWEAPKPDVLDFYSAADVYLSPSREDSFGLPVAEAMACGLPAITSVDAGVAASIQDGIDAFVLQNPNNVDHLAQIIRRLHQDVELRRNIGEAAAKTASEWTWDRHADAMWEVISALNNKCLGQGMHP